jgi:glyoxylase-like metal-dependent hydrolase (beta-lactamase superfamily II)
MKVKISSLLVLTFMLLWAVSSVGQAPQKIDVGDFQVWKLQDTQMDMKLSMLTGVDPAEALKVNGGKDSQISAVNAFLVKTGKHTILIDAGIGKGTGGILDQMKLAGIEPAAVDLILLTHLHPDHIGNLTSADGKRIFPNATIRLSQTESDFWVGNSGSLPANQQGQAGQIKKALDPYIQAKAYVPFSATDNLGDGIKAIAAYGHTAGHTIYTFASKGSEFWCIGDLIHFGNVQFKLPKASVSFDGNGKQALESRMEFFSQAAAKKAIVGGAHLVNFYRLEKEGDSFNATPVK